MCTFFPVSFNHRDDEFVGWVNVSMHCEHVAPDELVGGGGGGDMLGDSTNAISF